MASGTRAQTLCVQDPDGDGSAAGRAGEEIAANQAAIRLTVP
ncbi:MULTISPECIES: hypothetical protein [Methylobacteriaceae]